MNELMLERMESSNEAIEQEAADCPMQGLRAQRAELEADEELVFPKHKRLVTQYLTDKSGASELHLYYGEKEISFDDPELFAFGEGLAKQSRFVAGTATSWGEGYDWPRVRELLEQLIEEGILRRADDAEFETNLTNGACPSRLPPARSKVARTWFECEAITRELAGRPLELGYLELLIPIYRVAHIALDEEGRQVGEANVFPKQLRLDIPTEWRTCPHVGSRYHDDLPMNVTALKSMRTHWRQVMVALLRIRETFLRRFPQARCGWTVGDLERLSSLVLTLPAYLLMRMQDRVENGHLHPVLSSMYRVTDGVRMTMHYMLFIPANEPILAPNAPMTSSEIYAYAERNAVFLSEYGVCAGPKAMIEEFLHVLVDGKPVEDAGSVMLDAPVEAALDELDRAFDYGFYGLQAHAVVFSLWTVIARTYERLWNIVDAWPRDESETLTRFRERLKSKVKFIKTKTYVGTEEWQTSRERVFEDMFAKCASGLGIKSSAVTLSECISPVWETQHADATNQLRVLLRQRFCPRGTFATLDIENFVTVLMDYFRQEQAIVRAGCEIQKRINRLLGRTPPLRAFTASDIYLYYQLQEVSERPPYLVDELEEGFGLRIVVTQDKIEISDRTTM